MKKGISSYYNFLPYLIILCIILIFNIISIWGIDGLYQDDQEYYYRTYDKDLSDLRFSRNILHAIYTLEINKIASHISIYTARLIVLVFLLIPCSFLIYYLIKKHFKLISAVAIPIAILPFILPNETTIPAYISGSYTLMGIMFALLSINFILNKSESNRIWEPNFILAIVFYFLAFESTELFAFMLPVFLFLIFIFRKVTLKRVYLALFFSSLAILKSYMIMRRPHGTVNNVRHQVSLDEINHRIIHFMDFINPFHGLADPGFLNLLVIVIILTAIVILLYKHQKLARLLQPLTQITVSNQKLMFLTYSFIFPVIWLIFSSLPFIIFTIYFPSRYYLVAGIALNFMLIVSLGIIFATLTYRKIPLFILLCLLIISAGYNRQQNFKKNHRKLNEQFSELSSILQNNRLPEGSQIVVTTFFRNLTLGNGVTRRGKGVFQYIMKKRGFAGQIMLEKSYYDPFKIYNNPWGFKNADIDTTRKTILLRCFHPNKNKNKRMHYALRWVDENEVSSPWTLYYIDDELKFNHFLDGQGYAAYNAAADSLYLVGITRDDIMFGGIPDRKDSLRLGL